MPNRPKPASNGHTLSLAEVFGERGRSVHEKHRHDPVQRGGYGPPASDPYGDYRTLAKILAALAESSTAQQRAYLESIGVTEKAISKRQCLALSRYLLEVVNEYESDAIWPMPWEKLPHPDRDSLPASLGLNTRPLSEVTSRPVEWLWPQRVPLGKLTLLSGDPDLGKTWVVLDIISRITTGREFPDAVNPFGCRRNALWVSAEDDDDDTIRPRVDMLGGDPSRIESLTHVIAHEYNRDKKEQETVERTLNLSQHLEYLDSWLTKHPLTAIVVLDPLAAYLGKTDSHRNSDVRSLLTPLVKLAHKHQIALIGINHLSKGDSDNAIYRGMGSLAFVAAARSSWMVSRDLREPEDRRLLTKIKNNVASQEVGGLAFRVGPQHKGIFWEEGKVEMSSDEALRTKAQESSRAPALAEAKEWLAELLQQGPLPAEEVWSKAKADGMCERTIKKAKKELGVRTKKTGGAGTPWEWSLPKG